jgi:hypothetical protein
LIAHPDSEILLRATLTVYHHCQSMSHRSNAHLVLQALLNSSVDKEVVLHTLVSCVSAVLTLSHCQSQLEDSSPADMDQCRSLVCRILFTRVFRKAEAPILDALGQFLGLPSDVTESLRFQNIGRAINDLPPLRSIEDLSGVLHMAENEWKSWDWTRVSLQTHQVSTTDVDVPMKDVQPQGIRQDHALGQPTTGTPSHENLLCKTSFAKAVE